MFHTFYERVFLALCSLSTVSWYMMFYRLFCFNAVWFSSLLSCSTLSSYQTDKLRILPNITLMRYKQWFCMPWRQSEVIFNTKLGPIGFIVWLWNPILKSWCCWGLEVFNHWRLGSLLKVTCRNCVWNETARLSTSISPGRLKWFAYFLRRPEHTKRHYTYTPQFWIGIGG